MIERKLLTSLRVTEYVHIFCGGEFILHGSSLQVYTRDVCAHVLKAVQTRLVSVCSMCN